MQKWLEKQIRDVSDAFHARLYRETAARNWLLCYHDSAPGMRGGLCVIRSDDQIPDGWRPEAGAFSTGNGQLPPTMLTRDQIRQRIWNYSRNLPVLDPDEPYDG